MSTALTDSQSALRYSQILRCIGSSLEPLELKALELKRHGDIYIAQGWQKGPFSSMDFEKHFTLDDVKKLELEGRAKRKPVPTVPNLLSLSQILRLAGSYVDRMGGRLLRVSWQDQSDKIQSITVQYEPLQPERQQHTEYQVHTVEEICVHLYRQRKKIAAGSDRYANRPFINLANDAMKG